MLTRRRALTVLLMGGTMLAAPRLLAQDLGRGAGMPWKPFTASPPYHGVSNAVFLNPDERAAVEAICARLIPTDEDGPGATDADVVTFIDRQLAGFFGRGQNWYMKGPHHEGLSTQGYQSEHPPAMLYRLALAELDAYCEAEFGGAFATLDQSVQDEILTGLDEEDIEFESVSAKTFFDLILENAIEGFFADPIYGGNRDMIGWRYVGFPGTRYDYREFVNHNGSRLAFDPVSLTGRTGWSE